MYFIVLGKVEKNNKSLMFFQFVTNNNDDNKYLCGLRQDHHRNVICYFWHPHKTRNITS